MKKKFNETYSPLKESYPSLSEEQSPMKIKKEKKAQQIIGIERVIKSKELDSVVR